MDGLGIEEIEIARFEVDFRPLDALFLGEFVEISLFEMGLEFWPHRRSVENPFTAVVPLFAVLKAEHARELMSEAGNGEVVAFGPLGHGVVVRIVAQAFMVGSEDGGSVKAAVGFPRSHDLFVREHSGEGTEEGLHGVFVVVKERGEEFVGLARMLIEGVRIIPR